MPTHTHTFRQRQDEDFSCAAIQHIEMTSSEDDEDGEEECEECEGEGEGEGEELLEEGLEATESSQSSAIFGACPFQQQPHTHVLTISMRKEQQRMVQATWHDLVDSWTSGFARGNLCQTRMEPIAPSSAAASERVTLAFSILCRHHGSEGAACKHLSFAPLLVVPGALLLSTSAEVDGLNLDHPNL
jgi:hypothetical protein